MSLTNEINMELYRQMVELQEKLRKSEEERMKLEEKFRFLMKSCREEEEIRLRNLQERYAKFLEECSKRNDRNDKILRSIEKVESGANILFAKTERLKVLRSHYEAYLERVMPQWKQPSALTYKSTYSSSIQQTPNTFRPSYSTGLTSTSSNYLGNYAAGATRSTDDNDRILDFIKSRRPFLRDRSFSTTNYADTIITKREVVPPPVASPPAPTPLTELERKPDKYYYEIKKPDDEVVKEIQPDIQVTEVLPEIQRMSIEEKQEEIPNEKTYYKENQEIECLSEKDELPAARKKREVDYVLSDEEIVENIQPEVKHFSAPPTPPSIKREIPPAPATPKKELNVGKLAPDITAKFDAPVTYPKSPIRSPLNRSIDEEDLSPVTKRNLVEHQKSIEQLKAALSIEEPEIEQEVHPQEETDVTESSSEVWQPQQTVEDWQQVQEQAIIPSDVEEIENQFAEIVNNPSEQYYEEQQPVYEEQQNEIIDYSEEQYPESYYEQPAQTHYPTNIASNVILEEDEYEEQEYTQEQKPEFEQNYQEQNYEYQQDGQYQQEYQNYQQDGQNYQQDNQNYQQDNFYDENNQQYQENYNQENYDQNYQQQNYQENYPQENTEQYQNYNENNYQTEQFDQNNQQYDQNTEQYDQNAEQFDQNAQQYDQNNQQYNQNSQQYDQNNQQFDQNNQQYDQNSQQYDQNYTQEGEYSQEFVGDNMVEQVPQEEYQYSQEQGEGYQQENFQGEQDATVLQKQSTLAQLLESDSESYQIEHGGGNTGNEDSDFDFSLSQKQ